MPSTNNQGTLQDLPSELTLSIINDLDDVSSNSFALTSRTHYYLVIASKGSLASLQPQVPGFKLINYYSSQAHETFACTLLSWLGSRCVYCGIREILAQEWVSY